MIKGFLFLTLMFSACTQPDPAPVYHFISAECYSGGRRIFYTDAATRYWMSSSSTFLFEFADEPEVRVSGDCIVRETYGENNTH